MPEFELDNGLDVTAPEPEKPTDVTSLVEPSSSFESEGATLDEPSGGDETDPELVENDERLEREEDNRVDNVKAERGLLVGRAGFPSEQVKNQASESKKNDAKALHQMIQRQQEMLSFKLDGQEIKISKEDFRKHLEKWHKEDTEKAKAALKRGDQKLYEQLTKQADASAQLLKDLDMGKDVDPELVKKYIGDNKSKKAELFNEDEISAYTDSGMKSERVFTNDRATSYSSVIDGPNDSTPSSKIVFNQAAAPDKQVTPAVEVKEEVLVKHKTPDNNAFAY